MSAPERIWAFRWPHGGRAWRTEDMECPVYAIEYIRKDASDAAIAAARAEGVREGMLKAAEIAVDYSEWCANWGEHRNQVAADTAAKEIASALRAAAEAQP